MDLDAFIKRVRDSKQFDHLYHFTDRKNLPSIKSDGLLCTSELRRLERLDKIVTGGDAASLASDTASGTDKFVCLCLTTNHPMSFRAAERGVDPVYLSIDPEVITQRHQQRFSTIGFTLKHFILIEFGLNDFNNARALRISNSTLLVP